MKDEKISKIIGHLLTLRESDPKADKDKAASDLLDSMGELYKTRGIDPTEPPNHPEWDVTYPTGSTPDTLIDPATGLPALVCRQGTVDPICPDTPPPTGREDIPFWTESHIDLITNTAFPDPFLNDSDGHAGTTHDIDAVCIPTPSLNPFANANPYPLCIGRGLGTEPKSSSVPRPAVALSTVLNSDDIYIPKNFMTPGTEHTAKAFCRVYEPTDRNAPAPPPLQLPWNADAETIATCELEHKTKVLASRFKPSYLFPPFIRKRIESGELVFDGVLQLKNGTIEYDNWLVETDPKGPLIQMTPDDFHTQYKYQGTLSAD